MTSLLRRLMGIGKKGEEEKPELEGEVKEIRPVPRMDDKPEPINGSCLRDALERAEKKRQRRAELHSYSRAERERMLAEAKSKEELEKFITGAESTVASGAGLGITGSFKLPAGAIIGPSTGEHRLSVDSIASRRIDGSAMTIVAVVDHLKKNPKDERFVKEIIRAVRSNLLENDTSIEQFVDQFDMTEEQKTQEELALEALAKKITDCWTDVDFDLDPEIFTLAGSQNLTIYRPATASKPGFSKKSHIGGEEFIPVRAYVGKRGAIICVFKPVSVEDYATMEMPLQECFQSLNGFQRYFVEADLSKDLNAIAEARNAQKKAEDMAKFGARYDDFGSF